MITATCVVQAMIFFPANRSTLAAMLFHASLNASQFILNITDNAARYIPLMWVLATAIAVILMPRPWFGPPRDGGAPEA
jgi:hypothetical protein